MKLFIYNKFAKQLDLPGLVGPFESSDKLLEYVKYVPHDSSELELLEAQQASEKYPECYKTPANPEDHLEELSNIVQDRDDSFGEWLSEQHSDEQHFEMQDQFDKTSSISKARTLVRIAQSAVFKVERSAEAIELMQKALMSEFRQWDLYYAYKSQLKGLSRDIIEEHFAEHAEEEAEHIEVLQRYLVTSGIQPTKERHEIPKIDGSDIEKIIGLQYKFEVEAVRNYQELLEHLEDSDPLRIEVENILAKEMEHAQDLQLLF